jgi:hypothetical protein
VYVCGEPAAVPVPSGGPAEVSLEQESLKVLQVGGGIGFYTLCVHCPATRVAATLCADAMDNSSVTQQAFACVSAVVLLAGWC